MAGLVVYAGIEWLGWWSMQVYSGWACGLYRYRVAGLAVYAGIEWLRWWYMQV